MATQEHIEIVKSTIPVLEEHGTQITKVFYKNMFADHPELLDIFNKTNQQQGRQQTALAMTVLAAAKHIENLAVLLPQVKQIGHKHRALQIQPEHYPIVGKYLLGAIKEVLGDAATDDIIEAWADAYNDIASVFIQVEKQMYANAAWQGFVPFTVSNKQIIATDIAVFYVKPKTNNDNHTQQAIDLDKLTLNAGQYITVKTHPADSDNLALRHYSLCSTNTDNGISFAVRRDNRNAHHGLVSNYLHDNVNIGDEILLSAPAGDFQLQPELITQNNIPLVLISAGVGITPVLAMLETQIHSNPNRPIIWAYACQNNAHHAFADEVEQLLAQADNVEKHIFYSEDGQRLDDTWLASLPKPADVYVCGSMPFMESIIDGLHALEHGKDSVHYEPFGPKMSLGG
ncbi:globin domain-containing protein [Psychrobacter sp. I-STPA10]|uniref:globin domain-containing protein n=1 Tax=Psychrobacter sp. I-STPA10 TaxID=2585769 RepID=UPI001E4965CC|nr:globin domain-containing protein [Psychrobacter sp. I-STPA10]